VVDKAEGAPNVASALNISAFKLGIAGGALLGGIVVASPLGLGATPWVEAIVTLVGLALAGLSAGLDRSNDSSAIKPNATAPPASFSQIRKPAAAVRHVS
jgi:predicted MFS family arabinose efflux permease